MNRLWKILFFATWLVIVGIIIFLALTLAIASQTQSQQQVINQYTSKGNGPSAYDVAVKNGFSGSEVDWVASLKGDTAVSQNTIVEKHVETKTVEQVAVTGPSGKSSYDIWLDLGNVGTPQNYIDSLKGSDGKTVITSLRLNETTGKLEIKSSIDNFWRVVPSCGGVTGRVCN